MKKSKNAVKKKRNVAKQKREALMRKTCVVSDIKSDKMETVDELLDTLQRIMK